MSKESLNATPIDKIGEFGLIERLFAISKTAKNPQVIRGIGDDAAVLSAAKGVRLIAKDLFCSGVHFDTSYMPLTHIGYKAVVACLSDIVAMNGLADALLVGLGISSTYSVESIEALYEGMTAACKRYGVALVGGDTVAVSQGLVISVTATGSAVQPVYRSGAQVGDCLCVSGTLGGAYVGLQILRREKYAAPTDPQLGPYKEVLTRQLKPLARVDVIQKLGENNIVPTAMIDVSDGLFSEILHLCQASNQGVEVYEEHLPIASSTHECALELNLAPLTCACHGGEDYELLLTLAPEQAEMMKDELKVIGKITAAQTALMRSGEDTLPITAQGWQHFSTS